MTTTVDIAVVAATCNRVDLVPKMMGALKRQTLDRDRFEVVLSDDGSSDGTLEVVEREALSGELNMHLLKGSGGGPARARNRALAKVAAPYVAFTDDDTVPAPNWLECHLAFMDAHPELAGAGGRIRRVHDTTVGRYIDYSGAMRHPVDTDGAIKFLVTANAVYRTEWLRRVEGFNEAITWPGGEDPDLSFRIRKAGGRLGLNLDAEILHHHRDTLPGLFRTFYQHGKGLAVNIRHGSKQRDTSAFRLFAGGVTRGSQDVIACEARWTDKPMFLVCNLTRAMAFARGFAAMSDYQPEAVPS